MLATSLSSSSGSSSLIDNLLFLPLAPSLRVAHYSRSDVELVSSSSDIRAGLSQESKRYPCCSEEVGGQVATARRRVEKTSEARLKDWVWVAELSGEWMWVAGMKEEQAGSA